MAGWNSSTPVPLSITEQRILDLNHRRSLADLITRAMKVKGQLDIGLFKKAISDVVNAYPIFRCRYQRSPTTRTFEDIELDYLDARSMSDSHLVSFLRQFGGSPIDLGEDPLLGLSLLRTGEDEYIFLTKCHHIITDGISLSLLWSETLARYLYSEQGKVYQPRVESTDFPDYIHFENTYLESAQGQQEQNFWRDKLQAQVPDIEEAPHGGHVSLICREMVRTIKSEEFERIKERTTVENVSLYVYLAAAFQLVLCDLVQGSFWMNGNLSLRFRSEHREVFGPMFRYVNLGVERDESWQEKLERLSAEIKYAVHSIYAADAIGPHGPIGHNLDVSRCHLVTFLQAEKHREGFLGVYTGEASDWVGLSDHLKIRTIPMPTRLTPYGIFLSLAAYGGQLRAGFVYNINCFNQEQMETLIEHWHARLLYEPEGNS